MAWSPEVTLWQAPEGHVIERDDVADEHAGLVGFLDVEFVL